MHSQNNTNQTKSQVKPPLERPAEPKTFVASNWKAIGRKTLLGSCTIELPSGLILKEILVHEREQARWVQLPSREWQTATGEKKYIQLFDFSSEAAKNEFRDLCLEAVDQLLRAEP